MSNASLASGAGKGNKDLAAHRAGSLDRVHGSAADGRLDGENRQRKPSLNAIALGEQSRDDFGAGWVFGNQQPPLAKYLFCQIPVIARGNADQVDQYRYGTALVIQGGAACYE